MLQTIRDHTQGWIAGTIITIVILSFALWGIHSYFIGGSGNGPVAEVNGIDITREQLAVAYERVRHQMQIQSAETNSISMKDEPAIREGFTISDTEVDHYLQSMPDFQVDGQFSVERFRQIIASSMLSTSDF